MENQYLVPPEDLPVIKKNKNLKPVLLGLILVFNIGLIGINLVFRPKSQEPGAIAVSQSPGTNILGVTEAIDVLQPSPTPQSYELGFVLVSFHENVTYGQAKKIMKGLSLSLEGRNDYWKEQGVIPHEGMPLSAGNLFKVQVPQGDEEIYVSLLKASELVKFATYNFVVTAN